MEGDRLSEHIPGSEVALSRLCWCVWEPSLYAILPLRRALSVLFVLLLLTVDYPESMPCSLDHSKLYSQVQSLFQS